MSIERASTAGQSQFLLSQVQNASLQLGKTQAQVASGKVATDYAGLEQGDLVAETGIVGGDLAAGDLSLGLAELQRGVLDLRQQELGLAGGGGAFDAHGLLLLDLQQR